MPRIKASFITHLLFAIAMVLLSACVGTIEDASKKETSSNNLKVSPAEFEGIAQAVAISHNKVDVAFRPAVGGSGDFSYLVYLNGNFDRSVAAIDTNLIQLDSDDMGHIIVDQLAIGTNYSFSVRVYDKVTDQTDTNRLALNATTLSYEVPLFEGIKSLENASGKLGESSLVVSWNKATSGVIGSSGFGDDVNAISGYNIYFGTTPTDLSNVVPVNGADVTSYVLSGLKEGTEYYVRVRARNSDNPNQEEVNIGYLTKKTTTSQLLNFGGVGNLSIPIDRSGYHYINVNWLAGSGSFDSYKIFMDTSPTPFQKDFFEWKDTDFEVVKKITDTNIISKLLYVEKSNTPYYVAVVACGTGIFGECTNNMGYTSVKNITPTPPVVPFAGIKEFGGVESVSGLSGLTSVNLYWDAPNPTLGVFKRIEVYDCSDINYLSPRTTTLNDLYSPDVSLRVTGLVTGQQYCLVALAVEDVDSLIPRRSVTITPRYVTPSFVPPILNGLTSCYQVNSKGFKVNWPQATVSTMLSNYEVFVKQKTTNGSFSWTDAILATNQAATVTDFNNDSSKYFVNYVSTTTFNYTYSGLLPGTTYQLGVRTYLSNGSKEYRSNPGMILECTTDNISAIHQGWLDVFAIGPKYDGIDKAVVKERLAFAGEANVLGAYKHLFAVEDNTVTVKISGSDQGIIRINWYDFKFSNGDSVVNNPNAGYKVYRKTHSVLYNNYMPAFTESVDNDPTWQLVSGADLIKPKTDTLVDGKVTSFGQFIDYTATHPADLKEGQIYYYRVELYLADKHIDYGSASAQIAANDIILRVVLPPKNMAFMHRWMANKQMCEEMKKTPDRNNNYRCAYDGLGSVYIDGAYYYDMKGDVFTDRFMLSCPFSRGDSDYKCSEVSSNSYPNFEGRAVDDNRNIKLGDCVGISGNPNNKISAKKGAIFFDRNAPNSSETCFINTSTTGSGSEWKSLDDIDSIQRGYASQTTDYFTKSNAGNRSRLSTKIPPDGSNFPSGEGWGLFIHSNDAGWPQLVTGSNGLNWTCQSGSFSVNNKTYLKRLMRRKEQVAAFAMSPLLEGYNQSIGGKTEIKIATGLATPSVNVNLYPLSSSSVDRDCNVNSNGSGTYMYKSPGKPYGSLNLKKPSASNAWSSRLYGGSNNTFIAWFANGSSGAISTDACVTRFGLQDYVGQGNEALSDVLYCKKSTKFCSFSFKDLAGSSPLAPPWDEDNKYNWKNALGYTSFSSNHLGNNPDRLGSPLLFTEEYPYTINFNSSTLYYIASHDVLDVTQVINLGTTANPNKQTKTGMKYFSLAMGVPLICEGKGCNYGTAGAPQYTDDTKFALQAGRPTSETTQLASDYQEWMHARNLASVALGDEFLLSISTGHPSWINSNMQPDSIGKNRRYSLIYDPLPPRMRGRCTQLVESY